MLTADESKRFWKRVRKTSQGKRCWLWLGQTTKGYGVVKIRRLRDSNLYAHRISYQLHEGEIPNGLLVLHSCDNPVCVNPEHLFVGTQADNIADMLKKGRQSKGPREATSWGESHYKAKLSCKDVKQLRSKFSKQAHSMGELACMFGISKTTVFDIVRGRTRKRG